MTCFLSLFCSVIGSVELYLTIQKNTDIELTSSKDYYILSIDIYKTLSLSKDHRPMPAKEYLDTKYNEYVKLYENSNLLEKKIVDKLNPLPIELPASISLKHLISNVTNNTNTNTNSDVELDLELSSNEDKNSS